MGFYGTILRTAISVLVVPGILFVFVVLAEPSPLLLGPLFWAAVVAGLMTGLVGSALESYRGYHQSLGRRFVYWMVTTTAIVYGTRWFVPIWPITLFGAILMGILLGVIEMGAALLKGRS